MDEQEGGSRGARPPIDHDRVVPLLTRSADRRRTLSVVAVVVVLAVISGGTGLTVALARSSAPPLVRSLAASCVAPDASPSALASSRIGGWHFQLAEVGTFGAVAPGPSSLYALQACGAEETALRVVELQPNGKVAAVSPDFDRAALLTSSLVLADGSLYVGTARLDLSGSVTAAPYELTLYRLSASSLNVLGSRALGRGYGLSLAATGSGGVGSVVVASTGAAVLVVQPGSLATRRLASFGASVAQHIAVQAPSPSVFAKPASSYVAVSVFAPAATSPALGGTIELLDVVTGGVVSSVRLPGGSEVESMALAGGSLFVATGTGASSDVRRLPAPKLRTSGRSLGSGTGMPTTLESISLDSSGGIVWASDQTALVCLDPSTGRALASTAPPSLLSAVVTAGATTYAVTGSGIGELRPPAAC